MGGDGGGGGVEGGEGSFHTVTTRPYRSYYNTRHGDTEHIEVLPAKVANASIA